MLSRRRPSYPSALLRRVESARLRPSPPTFFATFLSPYFLHFGFLRVDILLSNNSWKRKNRNKHKITGFLTPIMDFLSVFCPTHSSYFANKMELLCPPNPKELDSTTLTSCSIALFPITIFKSTASSGSSKFKFG